MTGAGQWRARLTATEPTMRCIARRTGLRPRFPRTLRLVRGYLRIRVPVRIFAAADDPLVPVANGTYLAERIPGSELTILPAAHFAWEEVPDQFAAIIADAVTSSETESARSGRSAG